MPEKTDPINNIQWLPAADLHPNAWNPNRVHVAEMRLLETSLLTNGWIQPVLSNLDGLIIDGFHRWRLSQDSPIVKRRWSGKVPVAQLDIPTDEAMALTVRINRAKGTHVAIEVSNLVRALLTDYDWTTDRVAKAIGAGKDEVQLLAQDGVFQAESIKDHAYSPAWYPKETRVR